MTKPFLGTVLLTLFGACVAGAQTGAAVFSEAFANAAAWRPWPGDQTLTIDQEVFRSGTGSLRVTAPASTAYTYWDLKPQMRYRLTAWVKLGGAGSTKSKFHVKFNKAGQGNGSAGEQALPLPPASSAATDWREVVLHFDTPPETARAQFLILAGQGEIFWIDSLTLAEEQSGAAAAPAPAPVINGGASAQTGTTVFSEAFANASGWRPWPGNQTLAIDREVFRVGTGSLRVAAPASTAYIYWDLKPEMRYRLAAWIKNKGTGTIKSKFHVKFNKEG